jgi:hypothetical protein
MVFNPRLAKYVQAGLSRGFSHDHIADVLRKHGHTTAEIDDVFSRVSGKPQQPKRWVAVSVALGTTFLLFTLLALGQQTESPTAAVTGNVVNDLQGTADRIAVLQSKVDSQQSQLDEALARANNAELSKAEKEKLLEDLQAYYDGVKQEREETKSALFDLWTFLFSKS